jgi:hypothetical protein
MKKGKRLNKEEKTVFGLIWMKGKLQIISLKLVAILGTVIDYLAGDLLILPRVGSLIGAIINGGLAALIAIAVAAAAPAFTTTTFSVLVFAVLIAVGEYFFHQYLLKADKVEP